MEWGVGRGAWGVGLQQQEGCVSHSPHEIDSFGSFYLALLNHVLAKRHGCDAESPGRFEVLDAILSPHLVMILTLLFRRDRAALLASKWGVGASERHVRDSNGTRSGRREQGAGAGTGSGGARRRRRRAAGAGEG